MKKESGYFKWIKDQICINQNFGLQEKNMLH